MTPDLQRLLRPSSIAVIGGGAWCANVIDQSRKFGFAGPIWPVHPNKSEFAREPELTFVSTDIDSWLPDVLGEQELPDHIALKFSPDAGDAHSDLDPDLFRRVIINLLDNAKEAILGSETEPGNRTTPQAGRPLRDRSIRQIAVRSGSPRLFVRGFRRSKCRPGKSPHPSCTSQIPRR